MRDKEEAEVGRAPRRRTRRTAARDRASRCMGEGHLPGTWRFLCEQRRRPSRPRRRFCMPRAIGPGAQRGSRNRPHSTGRSMRSQGRRGRESGSRPRNQVARARVAAAAGEPKVGPSRKKPALASGREDDDARINLLGPLPRANKQREPESSLISWSIAVPPERECTNACTSTAWAPNRGSSGRARPRREALLWSACVRVSQGQERGRRLAAAASLGAFVHTRDEANSHTRYVNVVELCSTDCLQSVDQLCRFSRCCADCAGRQRPEAVTGFLVAAPMSDKSPRPWSGGAGPFRNLSRV
ncbi:hypothetical protein HPB50_019103 [Hyalomma asiaticum]|uniref:Uncharacterized protein n=1 Tax=Hyalomma asiaticum TaxID=266040 RepID=A0ACB7SMX5_HYAAI|nr:hypothetical protein HPB50_019103 [Hyalomma asiaticum]